MYRCGDCNAILTPEEEEDGFCASCLDDPGESSEQTREEWEAAQPMIYEAAASDYRWMQENYPQYFG